VDRILSGQFRPKAPTASTDPVEMAIAAAAAEPASATAAPPTNEAETGLQGIPYSSGTQLDVLATLTATGRDIGFEVLAQHSKDEKSARPLKQLWEKVEEYVDGKTYLPETPVLTVAKKGGEGAVADQSAGLASNAHWQSRLFVVRPNSAVFFGNPKRAKKNYMRLGDFTLQEAELAEEAQKGKFSISASGKLEWDYRGHEVSKLRRVPSVFCGIYNPSSIRDKTTYYVCGAQKETTDVFCGIAFNANAVDKGGSRNSQCLSLVQREYVNKKDAEAAAITKKKVKGGPCKVKAAKLSRSRN